MKTNEKKWDHSRFYAYPRRDGRFNLHRGTLSVILCGSGFVRN